jgi:hypothetical protein
MQSALRECELYLKTTNNFVTSIAPAAEWPDYFRVHVLGNFSGETVTNSVLVHRFNSPKGNKIESTTATNVFVPAAATLRPVAEIADELRKALQPFWKLACSNNIIRIESKQSVWLLYPSLPGRDPGESEDHYARKNGYKTKYELKLTFEPRWSESQLAARGAERRPFEQAFEKGVGSKKAASDTAARLEKIPLPTFYSDAYSIFMKSPFGIAGVYPPEADARVVRAITLLKTMFARYPVSSWTAEIEKTPVWKIQSVLPDGWAISEVVDNTYPDYRPDGKGTAFFLVMAGKKYYKQDYSAAVYVMPLNYQDGGMDPTKGRAQTAPPRLIARTRDAKIYVWPPTEPENWRTMIDDLNKAFRE